MRVCQLTEFEPRHTETVRMLVEAGSVPAVALAARDMSGCTPLHYSVAMGHVVLIDWFFKLGAVLRRRVQRLSGGLQRCEEPRQ